MKKISSWRTVNDTVITLKVLSVFITICSFLDVCNVYKPSKINFAPVKNQTFRWTNKCPATLNTNRHFVHLAMSIVSSMNYAITGIHCSLQVTQPVVLRYVFCRNRNVFNTML